MPPINETVIWILMGLVTLQFVLVSVLLKNLFEKAKEWGSLLNSLDKAMGLMQHSLRSMADGIRTQHDEIVELRAKYGSVHDRVSQIGLLLELCQRRCPLFQGIPPVDDHHRKNSV